MSRIPSTFERLAHQGRKALIPFITAGDPDPGLTVTLMNALVAGGADVIELGVPFSDPMADGPTIQRASERALRKGVGLRQVLQMVRAFREGDECTPVVLMGYANPLEAYGIAQFVRDAVSCGVDGVLIVDYPPEECREFASICKGAGLDPIFLLAPTSSEQRFRDVAEAGSGYIYYVSLKGVTGSAHLDVAAVAERIPRIRELVGMPVGVGFGIRDGEGARRVAEVADAVVIGSRLIEELEQSAAGTEEARLRAFIASVRAAMDGRLVSGEASA